MRFAFALAFVVVCLCCCWSVCGSTLDIYVDPTINCYSEGDAGALHVVAHEGACAKIGSSFSAITYCNRYGTNFKMTFFENPNCIITRNFAVLYFDTRVPYSCAFVNRMSVTVLGCVNDTFVCGTSYSSWSAWSSSCGSASRVRIASSYYNDGYNTSCTPANPPITIDYRNIVCVNSSEAVYADVCNRATKTCWIYPDSPLRYSTFATFLALSPVFTHGWTLRVHGYRSDCPFSNSSCQSIPYTQPPIITGLHNISIVATETEPPVTINVIGSSNTYDTNWDGVPACGAFVLSGDNVHLSGFNIQIDPACYANIFPTHSLIKHGAAIRSAGQNAIITNITVANAVTGILFTPDSYLGKLVGPGNVLVTNLGILNTQPINSFGGKIASCLGVVIVSLGGTFKINMLNANATLNATCVVAFVPLKLKPIINTTSDIFDASAYLLPVLDETKKAKDTTNKTKNDGILYDYMIAVLLFLILFLGRGIFKKQSQAKKI
jgi:hypothetical protein